MSVVAGKRGVSKLEAIIKAQKVVKHILVITKNEKIFDVAYKALTEDINHCAERIYIKCYTANNIYARGNDNIEQRIKLQTEALQECRNLLALMDLAWQIFHLKSKKVEYVCKIVLEAMESIKAWRASDRKRLTQ